MFRERLAKIYSCRQALWDLARKQLKAKYAGSRLGLWWAVVAPLLLAVSINFIFTAVFKGAIPNYTLFVLAGIIPWVFFTNALTESVNSFTVNLSVLKQGVFPREFIPLSSILANLLNFLIGLIFLLPLFFIFKPKLILNIFFLAAIIFLHFLFTVGLGLLFATLNAFLRDLAYFLPIGFTVWFWITPIFYSSNMLPASFRWVCLLNPATYFVVTYQSLLFEGKPPSLSILVIAALLSMAALFLGYLAFLKKESVLLKRI